jgi:CRP-like cAMP-binding protein
MEKSSEPLKLHLKAGDPLLAKFRVFADLGEQELRALIEQSALSRHSAGETILSEGEEGHCMYVILRGRVRVLAAGVEIATVGEGDFFGEVALVDDGPRSADVVAVEDCELMVITRMTLGILAAVEPGAAIQLLAAIGRSLVGKLRADNARFRELILLGAGDLPKA